jgi:HK97 family phage prohead protease
MDDALEVRLLEGAEIRADAEGREKGFVGRLVPYGVPAPIGGKFLEVMERGVFAKSIKEAARDLPLLVNHRHDDLPIGKAVEWDDRPDGLWGRWVMADTEEARKVYGLIEGGHMSGLSCGFLPLKGHDVWDIRQAPDLSVVTRRQARLLEASAVTVPTWAEAVITHTRSAVAAGRSLRPRVEAWREWLDTVKAPV